MNQTDERAVFAMRNRIGQLVTQCFELMFYEFIGINWLNRFCSSWYKSDRIKASFTFSVYVCVVSLAHNGMLRCAFAFSSWLRAYAFRCEWLSIQFVSATNEPLYAWIIIIVFIRVLILCVLSPPYRLPLHICCSCCCFIIVAALYFVAR